MESRIDTFEPQSQLMIFERFWHPKRSKITPGLVIIKRYMWWIYREWVDLVGISRYLISKESEDTWSVSLLRSLSIALQLPHARNLNATPFGRIEVRLIERVTCQGITQAIVDEK